jgi:hypothetical protein
MSHSSVRRQSQRDQYRQAILRKEVQLKSIMIWQLAFDSCKLSFSVRHSDSLPAKRFSEVINDESAY